MTIAVLGIDLGKTLCSVVGLDREGAVVLRRRLRRSSLSRFVEKHPNCIVGMEACSGAHHFGRQFSVMQHDVRLMPPEYVRPDVKSHRRADSADQPTSRVLFDRGITIAKRRSKLDRWLRNEFASAVGRSERMRRLVYDMVDELHALDVRIKQLDRETTALSEADQSARLLRTVPAIGALNATALTATVGDASAFAKGRDFAAWLGLVPRQITTGGRPRLVGISKRGSTYMRILLTHGARAALPWLAKRDTALGVVASDPRGTRRNVVVVAVANKLTRIAWAVLSKRRANMPTPVLAA